MTAPVLLVLGAGPGVGLAVADRFAESGYVAVLAARSPHKLVTEHPTVQVDLTDSEAVRRVVAEVAERHGRIDVLHFNPSAWRQQNPLSLTVEELLEDLRLGVGPLLPAAQAARPYLSAGSRIVTTGSAAADKPWHEAASLGVQKAALRNLVISLDKTLQPDGIRAVNVQVDGTLADEGLFSPSAVAEAIFAAATRGDEAWTPLVHHP